jgi:hypothetical protein
MATFTLSADDTGATCDESTAIVVEADGEEIGWVQFDGDKSWTVHHLPSMDVVSTGHATSGNAVGAIIAAYVDLELKGVI